MLYSRICGTAVQAGLTLQTAYAGTAYRPRLSIRMVLISDAQPAASSIDKIDDLLEIKLRRSPEEKKKKRARFEDARTRSRVRLMLSRIGGRVARVSEIEIRNA